ncbi:PorT family protein [Aestuariivivens sp. NBU2969]|uniref:PorT family protein n=1 Tax=Aestuariivivens sp. NBU2969 TaxID=2873267 RepID=UPI001CBCF26C|nr:PorT family protein [Aestuariivivens sp. NBU2969]
MKAIYLLLALCIYFNSSTLVFSQDYVLGLKAGLNTNTIGDINSRGGSIAVGKADEVFSPKKNIGYQIGGYFNAELKGFFIRPELNYVSLENHYDFPNRASKWTATKFEIPILFGLEIAKPVSIYAGPSFNFFSNIQLEGVQVTSYSNGGPDIEKNTTSLNFGILARYNRFSIDLRYEIGTKATQEELLDINHSAYGVNLADLRSYTPKTLSLSFSVDIFRTDGTSIADLFKSNDKCGCPYKK